MASERKRGFTTTVEGERRSILVAVEPVVLEGALALLINRREHADVVELHASPPPLTRHFDAAVVSPSVPGGMSADVVIVLPKGGAGKAQVTEGHRIEWTLVHSHQDVIRLLEEHGGKPSQAG